MWKNSVALAAFAGEEDEEQACQRGMAPLLVGASARRLRKSLHNVDVKALPARQGDAGRLWRK
jgi:hypothetical protein